MSIGRIQLNRTIEKIIKHYLNHGRYPSFQTITSHLSSWLRKHHPGAPTFKPNKARKKEASNHKSYNQNIKEIHTDLSDAYQATIGHTKQVMDNFDYIETERKKLKHDLLLLEKDIDKLLMLETNVDYRYFEGEIIGFENASYVNQELSSISLDLENQKVTLKDTNHLSSKIKINPSLASFKTLMPASRTAALESLSRAFDDKSNTAWWEVVKTKTPGSTEDESSSGMRAELTVLFEEVTVVNEIRYLPHHGKTVSTKIEFTADGRSFHPLPGNHNFRDVTDLEVWEFDPITTIGFKFIYEKKEHDDRSAGQYQFYFGAKDISFFQKKYESEGILYTEPIAFNMPVRVLSMEANHSLPSGTAVDYEVAVYRNDKVVNELNWHPISSLDDANPRYSQYIEFNTKYYRTAHMQKAEATGEIINGMRLFRLIKDNGEPIISEIWDSVELGTEKETFDNIKNAKLFRGINQWKRERIYTPFSGEVPLNHVWNDIYNKRPENIKIDYLPISNTLDLTGSEGGKRDNFLRFTTCVYVDEEKVQPLSLSLIKTLSNGIRNRLGTYAVYINQQRQKTTHDEVTMTLNPGWNEIMILYHWGNMQERKDLPADILPDETYLGKFNFLDQTKIRADIQPMTFIEKDRLFYNVSPNNRSYFTIHERQVVLNYLPSNCLFQFRYEADISEELAMQELILRATLKRSNGNSNATPSINQLKLRIR